jgi:hypothetical protein
MVDAFLDIMLGPMRDISTFYYKHQLICNTVVISLSVYNMFFNKKNKEVRGYSSIKDI